MYDINKIKNFDYAKKYIDNFVNSENTQNKTAKELNIIGLYYKTLEEYEKSFEYFDKAIQLDKTYKAPYFNKGIIYYLKKDYKNAEKYFLLFLEIEENDFLSLLYLGYCYKDIKNYDKAIEYLEKAIKVMPDSYDKKSEVFAQAGISYFRNYKIKQSVKYMIKGFKTSSNDFEFIKDIYKIYEANKQYSKALLYNNYLLKNNPNEYEYRFNRAKMLYLLDKNKAAKNLFNQLSLANSTDYLNYVYLARIYNEENNFKFAEKYFLKVDELLKNNIEQCIEIGDFYNENNKKDNASKFYQKAINIDPDNMKTYQKVLPFALDNSDYTKNFEDIIDKQIDKNNSNIYDFYIYKVNFLETKKLYNESIHIINKAIENNPDRLIAYQIAKILYEKTNNIDMVNKMQISIDKIKNEGVRRLGLNPTEKLVASWQSIQNTSKLKPKTYE